MSNILTAFHFDNQIINYWYIFKQIVPHSDVSNIDDKLKFIITYDFVLTKLFVREQPGGSVFRTVPRASSAKMRFISINSMQFHTHNAVFSQHNGCSIFEVKASMVCQTANLRGCWSL